MPDEHCPRHVALRLMKGVYGSGIYPSLHHHHTAFRMVQKDSEITFKAERPSGDPNKLADYERAINELKAAHNLFVQLSHLDRRHNPIDLKKLQTHQQYCEQAFRQSQVAPLTSVSCKAIADAMYKPITICR